MVNRWQTENIYTFSPKMEAVADFIAYKDKFMELTVWHEECRSWYKNSSTSGKVTDVRPLSPGVVNSRQSYCQLGAYTEPSGSQ